MKPSGAGNGGHGMILHTTNGQDCLVFHTPNDTPNERVTLIDVGITPDGITYLGPGHGAGLPPAPGPVRH
ncbi:hypothetical protein ACFVTM_18555 [Arthrobacter sp. NPDC058130]|uniref:hypothetical protein n=1 Tax=Arthrobacter sp. NPDC058130 TaxID=3346353 RepID=UPI0036E0BE8D